MSMCFGVEQQDLERQLKQQQRAQELFSQISLGFIGVGNMAEAIIKGLLRNDLVTAGQILGSAPREIRREQLITKYAIKMTKDNQGPCGQDFLFICVKPQNFSEVLSQLKVRPETVVVSIAAGIEVQAIQKALNHQKVSRAMPNLPVTIDQGVTVFTASDYLTETEVMQLKAVFSAVGRAYLLKEEMMDKVTALSGSGPAFFFRFAEALTKAAEAIGFDNALAADLVMQTLAGSAALLCASGLSPQALREQVSSKGGTAMAGLAKMEQAQVDKMMTNTLSAALLRAEELAL